MMLSRSEKQKLREGARAAAALPAERINRQNDRSVSFLLVKITAYSAITGTTNRWEYQWTRANQLNDSTKSFDVVAGEAWYTGLAYNVAEAANTSTFVGPGVLVSNIPSGFSVKPVEGYVLLFPHRLSDGTERWLFNVPNAIDGYCS